MGIVIVEVAFIDVLGFCFSLSHSVIIWDFSPYVNCTNWYL